MIAFEVDSARKATLLVAHLPSLSVTICSNSALLSFRCYLLSEFQDMDGDDRTL